MPRCFAALCGLAVLLSAPPSAQPITPAQELLVSGLAGNSKFGAAVAVDGDLAVVGAYRADVGSHLPGAVFTFTRSGGSWTHAGRLGGLGSSSTSDAYGRNVDLAGGTVVASSTPKVYVADWTGSGWTDPVDIRAGEGCVAWAVATDGDVVAVDVGGFATACSDHVAVYRRATGGWTEAERIVPPASASDAFGAAIAVSDGRVFVGDPGNDQGGEDAGAVYVFERSGSGWTFDVVVGPGGAGAEFGHSVAADGDRAVAGAPGNVGQGGSDEPEYASVIERTGSGWAAVQRLDPLEFEPGDLPRDVRFGMDVAIDGDLVVVGASETDFRHSSGLVMQRTAYVYRQSSDGWALVDAVSPAGDGSGSTGFASAVDVSDEVVLVGMPQTAESGQAFAYDVSNRTTPYNRAPYPPGRPSLVDQNGGVLGGDPSSTASLVWFRAVDPDGDSVTATWEVYLGSDGAQVSDADLVVTRDVSDAEASAPDSQGRVTMTAEVPFVDLRRALLDAGVSQGTTADVVHRVVLDDGQYEATGEWGTARLTIGGFTSSDAGPPAFVDRGPRPNPTAGPVSVVVDLPVPSVVSVEVFDVLGRLVSERLVSAPAGAGFGIDLRTTGLPGGAYSYRIRSETTTSWGAFTVAR